MIILLRMLGSETYIIPHEGAFARRWDYPTEIKYLRNGITDMMGQLPASQLFSFSPILDTLPPRSKRLL